MNENYVTLTIGKQKNIALIAHDNKKAELIAWCETNKEILKNHFLCGTGTTGTYDYRPDRTSGSWI
mgnify:CR=1 FL=1